jgi:hypothetical protein
MNAARKYDILRNHNEYELPISRNNAETIKHDPFGLGNSVTGLTNLNFEKNLSNYAEEIVAHYARYEREQYELSLSDLPEQEQNELARLYIESIDREIEWACYGSDESINSNYLCALLSMLKDDCQETREKFAEVTRKNIIIYYEKSLQKLLDEACLYYQHSKMNEQGYYAHRDMEHGDFLWSAF